MPERPTPHPLTAADTAARLLADRARLRAMLAARFGTDAGWPWLMAPWVCVWLQRQAHQAWQARRPWVARAWTQLNSLLTGADLHPHCDFGPGLLLPHPVALTASGSAGPGFTMMALSGIGMLPRALDVGAGPGLPLLGSGIWLGAGCGVLGPVRVGDGVRVESGAALTHDAPTGARVLQNAALRRVDEPSSGAPRARPTPRAPGRGTPQAAPMPLVQALRADAMRYLQVRSGAPGAGGDAVPEPGTLRLVGTFLTHELMALALHRLAHAWHGRGWPRAAWALAQLRLAVFRSWVAPGSRIGPGCFLPHPAGLVIDADAGAELTMYARAVLAPAGEGGARPQLGDAVVMAGMSAALGDLRIGSGARVGFNVQLQGDADAGSTVAAAGMRARIVEAGAAPASARAGHEPGAGGDDTPSPLGTTRALLREDFAAIARACGAAGVPRWPAQLAALLHRVAHRAWQRRQVRAARWAWQANVWLSGADIDPRCRIAGGLVLLHPAGVSLHAHAGSCLTLGALVALGADVTRTDAPWDPGQWPRLGNDVRLDVHAAVHGPVRVGDGVRIGAGCKVHQDLPPHTAWSTDRARVHRPAAATDAGAAGA